jgi:hypothetical protein
MQKPHERTDDDGEELREPIWAPGHRRHRVGPRATSEDIPTGPNLLDGRVPHDSVSVQSQSTLLASLELIEVACTPTSAPTSATLRRLTVRVTPLTLPAEDSPRRRGTSSRVHRPARSIDGHRSRSFEVLAVTQCTPHCLRVTLLAEEIATSELKSGQELSLAHNGFDGTPSRWIVREFNPRTNHLTVGAILALGSLDAYRWASSVVPGELVRVSIPNEG